MRGKKKTESCVFSLAAHVSLGVALGQAKRPEEAREAFLSAVRLDGRQLKDPKSHESARISALFHLGRQLLEQEQPQHALPYLLQAKDQMPNHYQPQVCAR
jgi:protein O-mannosyl-transferase